MRSALISLAFLIVTIAVLGEETKIPATEKDQWIEKLQSTIIEVDFDDISISGAVSYIVNQCREKDDSSIGVPVFGSEILERSSTRVDWKRERISCAEALYKIVSMDQLRLLAKNDGIQIIGPPSEAELRKKMERIILPSVEFVETPLRDALDFLQTRTFELDMERNSYFVGVTTIPPEEKGIGRILDRPLHPNHSRQSGGALAPESGANDGFGFAGGGTDASAGQNSGVGDTLITMRLSNVSALRALEAVCDEVDLLATFENGVISIVPKPTLDSKGSGKTIYKKAK